MRRDYRADAVTSFAEYFILSLAGLFVGIMLVCALIYGCLAVTGKLPTATPVMTQEVGK